MPDEMAQMMANGGHPNAGANCAYVPRLAAATCTDPPPLVNVAEVQAKLASRERALDDILTLPLLDRELSAEIRQELDNNAQGILGYMGAGLTRVSVVPRCRTSRVGLMETALPCVSPAST